MQKSKPKFCVGQLIRHKKFDYHGVILGVDPEFNNTDEWYETMARSRPPKDRPWYHVKVHAQESVRYVAERHLELDPSLMN
ncbi:MAG: heat shock protein HspQ [Nitrospina sp.]|nr:MAG: heat shock protein HspQ [Nitrospina sp.]TDJ62107.1 MAG: heat shock protein HspQ [Nitrospina sp.]